MIFKEKKNVTVYDQWKSTRLYNNEINIHVYWFFVLKERQEYRFLECKNKRISFSLWTFCYVSSKTFIYIKKSRLSNKDIAVEWESGSRKRLHMVRPVLVPFQFIMHIFILLETEETVTYFFLIVIFKEPSAW